MFIIFHTAICVIGYIASMFFGALLCKLTIRYFQTTRYADSKDLSDILYTSLAYGFVGSLFLLCFAFGKAINVFYMSLGIIAAFNFFSVFGVVVCFAAYFAVQGLRLADRLITKILKD